MVRTLFALCSFLLLGSLYPAAAQSPAASTQPRQETYVLLSPKAYQKLLKKNKKLQLVDVRTPEEFEGGHIKGFTNIDFLNPEVFEKTFARLDRKKPVAIYCRTGKRSRRAAEKLQEMGFEKIYDLEGGYTAWKP